MTTAACDGAELGASRLETGAGCEAPEELGHTMDAPGHHRCRQMMRTGDDVGDDLGFRRVWHRRLQHPDDRGRAGAESDGLAEHRRIAPEPRGPEAIGQHGRPGCVRAVVSLVEQPPHHRVQAHDLEIRSADHARPDDTWLAETDHREADGGEVAERAQ